MNTKPVVKVEVICHHRWLLRRKMGLYLVHLAYWIWGCDIHIVNGDES
jgi:hypothetical protein